MVEECCAGAKASSDTNMQTNPVLQPCCVSYGKLTDQSVTGDNTSCAWQGILLQSSKLGCTLMGRKFGLKNVGQGLESEDLNAHAWRIR